ncbi:MAG: HlyD family secretion protein [Rhodospirillaceae bacterium]
MPDGQTLEQSSEHMTGTGAMPTKRRRMLKRAGLLVGAPLLAVAGAFGYWLNSARFVSTENAYVKTDIAQVAAEVSGRVFEVVPSAHQRVRKDDVIVLIDRTPFEIAVDRAKAELDQARREIEILAVTLTEAQTELSDAIEQAAYFKKRFERQKGLAQRGITAATRYDELENDARVARDRVALARQKIARIKTSLGGDPGGPVDDHPLVRTKMAALEQAILDLDRTTLKSPADGRVVSVPLVAGEQIEANKALMAIVTDTPPWVEANFKETELTHVRPGQKAKVVLDIYPDVTWQAEVRSISPATGAEFAILPPQNASGNWVKVVQRLPVRLALLQKPDAPPLRAGMTATVNIDTERERTIKGLFSDLFAYLKSRI